MVDVIAVVFWLLCGLLYNCFLREGIKDEFAVFWLKGGSQAKDP